MFNAGGHRLASPELKALVDAYIIAERKQDLERSRKLAKRILKLQESLRTET